ncbi:MAG: hypothetical protein WCS94_20225 [Verrucomicrobiota bacterium]
MNKTQHILKLFGLALLCSLAPLFPTSGHGDEAKTAIAAAPLKAIYTAAETKEFKALAKATLEALAAGKPTEMVAKLTDLETAWDDQEKVLRPKDEAIWTLLDKTLDKAISALRSSHTNIPKGKAALEDLLKKLEQATKP